MQGIKQINISSKREDFPTIKNETNLHACKCPIFRSFSSKFNSYMLLQMQTNNGKQSHIHPCPAVLSLYLEQWTPPSLSFSPSLPLIREKRIFEMGTEEKVSPSSRQKCTTNSFLAYTLKRKRNTTFTFPAMVEKVNVV